MTTKQYLNQIRRADLRLAQRKRELDELRANMTYLTGISYDGVRVQTSNVSTGFRIPEDIADKELAICRMISDISDLRHRIIGEIESLEDVRHVQILMDRYVNYRTFEQIACDMGYSYVHTIRIHGDALREFAQKHDIK